MSTRETPSVPAASPNTPAATTTPTAEAVAERRRAERVAVDSPVLVHVDGMTPLDGRICNLSANGVLVAVEQGLPLGAEARLEIALDDEPSPLLVRGLVVRALREPAGERPVRLAFCFIHPSASAVRRVSRLVFS